MATSILNVRRLLCVMSFLVLGVWSSWAQKPVVWNEPATESGNYYFDGFFYPYLEVTRVELKKDETLVHVTLSQRPDYPRIAREKLGDGAHLLAGGVRYEVLSVEGLDSLSLQRTAGDRSTQFVFHFLPLPVRTQSFDWVSGANGAFQIRGIQPVEERWNRLFPSCWLDEQTGEWVIAFFKDEGCAIYDNQIWKMTATEQRGEATLMLEREGKKLEVRVGKNRKGRRTMQIGQNKRTLAMMTGRVLPDYPVTDEHTDFADTGYRPDTVAFCGWLKDMPDYLKSSTFNILTQDFFYDKSINYTAKLDSAGRFSIKFPLANTSEVFLDRGRCSIRTVFEPGKTYFLLYDCKEGRQLYMGDDVRVQNELKKYPPGWLHQEMNAGDDSDTFLAVLDSTLRAGHAAIDRLCRQHPTLSARFVQYSKDNLSAQAAFAVGQARFHTPDYKLSERISRYAYEHFWTKMTRPHSLHDDWRTFITDYVGAVANEAANVKFPFNVYDHIEEIASDADELAFMEKMKAWSEASNARIAAIDDKEELERCVAALNQENQTMIDRMNRILLSPRARRVVQGRLLLNDLRNRLWLLDSLGTDPYVRTAIVCQEALKHIEYESKALSSYVMDSLEVWTDHSPALAPLYKRNAYYRALAERKLDSLVFKPAPGVEGMTEGQEILNKLTQPYRGKYILLDVWGTWCAPCKQALSRFTEEYERLAPYDLQYMYLASNSPKDTWETVIKEYNVVGDNVAHFNLPHEQQEAVEAYLKVNSYPTYKLIDPQGRVLDVNVDACDLPALENLLKQLIAH